MNFVHVNLVARNADALARFYVDVMNCVLLRPPRILSSEAVSRGNGLENSEIYSIWLGFPGLDKPFLEIHQHKFTCSRDLPKVNEPGFAHLSFQTQDIDAALSKAVDAGGVQIGQTTDFGAPGKPRLIAYIRDPEGNVLELEQEPQADT